MSIDTVNARIESTMLGIEDHGIFTFLLHLEFEGCGQGFGGYALDQWDKELKRRVGGAVGIELIAEILKVVGVEKWEDLPGKYIRIVRDSCKVYSIGHILSDKWLHIDEFSELPR